MLKKLLLASAVTGLVAGSAIPAQAAQAPTPQAQAPMTCKEAALIKYPGDRKARRAYRESCKEAFKAQMAASVEEEPTYAGDM